MRDEVAHPVWNPFYCCLVPFCAWVKATPNGIAFICLEVDSLWDRVYLNCSTLLPCCTKMRNHCHELVFPQTLSFCIALTHCSCKQCRFTDATSWLRDTPGKSSNKWLAVLNFKVKNPILWGMVWFVLATLKAKLTRRFYSLKKGVFLKCLGSICGGEVYLLLIC